VSADGLAEGRKPWRLPDGLALRLRAVSTSRSERADVADERQKDPTSETLGSLDLAGLALLVVAILVRTLQYLANTSLSLDEAAFALNVNHRSYAELFDQLDFSQGAPPAFLALEKLAADAFGNTEYAFRAVPLAAGILGAFLMIPFIRRTARAPAPHVLALALFGLSGSLVLFSATGKPYIVDVLMTLALNILAVEVLHRPERRLMTIWLIFGAVVIWFSFAAVFVLAGIGSILIIRGVVLRRWDLVVLHSIVAGFWLASFAVLYLVSITDLGHLQESISNAPGAVGGAGGTEAPGVLQTLAGAVRSGLGIAHLDVWGYDLGRAVFAVGGLLALIGLVTLARERSAVAGLLTAPLVFALAAWELGKYPFFPRTLLFLTPAAIALIVSGTVRLATMRGRLPRAVGIAAAGLVVASIALPGLKHVVRPQRTSELKPTLRFLAQHQEPRDALWVYHASQYGLRYYLECECFGSPRLVHRARTLWPLHPAKGGADQFSPTLKSVPPRFIVSRSVGLSTAYRSELRDLLGRPRVWILISDAAMTLREPLLTFLNGHGTQRRVFRSESTRTSAAAYLYDLRRRH
jgi:hypothetical protein